MAWMVIAQLHLLVNSAISVLGCTIRLMNCQAEAKGDWNSVATLTVHDNWWRMLQDDEPPKSSWRPRKSTKSWVQLSVQKFTRVTRSRKKVHRVGKMVQPSLVAWRACTKIRDAPAEKRRESKSTKKLNEFVSQRRIERNVEQLPERVAQFKPYYAFIRMELATPMTQGCDGGLIAWISAKPTDWTPEVNYHISWIMAENQYYAENFVLLVVQGFIDSFFMLYFTYVSDIVIERPWQIQCPATIRSEKMSEQAQGDLLQTQSQDDEQARRDPLPLELPRRKV